MNRQKLSMMYGISKIQETSLKTQRLEDYRKLIHNSKKSNNLCDKMSMKIKYVVFACALLLTIFGVYFVTVYSGRQKQYDQLSDSDHLWLQDIMKEMNQKIAEKNSMDQKSEGSNLFRKHGNTADTYRSEERTRPVIESLGDLSIEWPKRDFMFASTEDSEEKDVSAKNDVNGEYADYVDELKQTEYLEESDTTKVYDVDDNPTVSNKEYHDVLVSIKTDADESAQNVKSKGYFSSTKIYNSDRQRYPNTKDGRIMTGNELNVAREILKNNKLITSVTAFSLLKMTTDLRENFFPYASTPPPKILENSMQNKIDTSSVANPVINEEFQVDKFMEPINPDKIQKSDPEHSVFSPNIRTNKVESVYQKLKQDLEYHAALLQETKANANNDSDSHMESDAWLNKGTVHESNSTILHSFDWYAPIVDQSVSDCTIFQTISGVLNICVYPEDQDLAMSATLRIKHTWEFEVLRDVQLALLKNNTYNLIDIGSSLGMYSLAAASLSRKVIAVEPFIAHVRRFQKSVMLNKFQSIITLLVNAISDKYEFVQVVHPEADMTASRVTPLEGDHLQNDINQMRVVNTITMNDLLNVCDFKSAILKMDIAGDEYKAMKYANTLFQTINIPFIFMHWANIQNLAHAGDIIAFLVPKGYEPRAGIDGELLDLKNFKSWAGDIVWHLKSGY